VSLPPETARLRSRRALLAGAAGVGVVALAGCGGKPLREKILNGGTVSPADVPVLNALLGVEHDAVAAYAAAFPLFPDGTEANKVAKQFLSQELAHVAELTELVKDGGGKAASPPADYTLGNPRTAAEALDLLERVERAELHAHLRLMPALGGGHVRAAIATIFANDSQHLAVVRAQSGQTPTAAFVVG
jgi:hypothetical protein